VLKASKREAARKTRQLKPPKKMALIELACKIQGNENLSAQPLIASIKITFWSASLLTLLFF